MKQMNCFPGGYIQKEVSLMRKTVRGKRMIKILASFVAAALLVTGLPQTIIPVYAMDHAEEPVELEETAGSEDILLPDEYPGTDHQMTEDEDKDTGADIDLTADNEEEPQDLASGTYNVSELDGNQAYSIKNNADVTFVIDEDKRLVLSSNARIYITGGGKLTIKADETKKDKTLTIGDKTNTVLFTSGGSYLTIESGNVVFDSDGASSVFGGREFNMKGGTVIVNDSVYGISAGTVNISGGRVYSPLGCGSWSSPTVNITGGTVKAVGKNYGMGQEIRSGTMYGKMTLNISGGNVYAEATGPNHEYSDGRRFLVSALSVKRLNVTGGRLEAKVSNNDQVAIMSLNGITMDNVPVKEPSGGSSENYSIKLGEYTFTGYTIKKDNVPAKSVVIGEDSPVPDLYKVTVEAANGTATADPRLYIEPGTKVNVSATPAEGYEFDKWTSEDGVAFADASMAETTFDMPAKDVTVKANFKTSITPVPPITPVPTTTPTPTPTVIPTPVPTPTPTPVPPREEQMGKDGTPLGEGASIEAAEKEITAKANDKDPKGAKICPLKVCSTSQTEKKITVKWTKAKKAVKYIVYGNKCGTKNKMKKLTSTKKTKVDFSKVAGKKVKKATYYKFIVVALDKNNDVVSTSKVIHVATKGGKVGNTTKLTVKTPKNEKATLKAGKTLKIMTTQAKTKGTSVKQHVGIRYESSNTKVATVGSNGKVKAKKKGKANITVYTQNGISKTIKITVK